MVTGLRALASGAGFGFCGIGLGPGWKPEEEDEAGCCGEKAGGLGIGHAEEGARIDADDFDEETSEAGKNKVESKEPTRGFGIAKPA